MRAAIVGCGAIASRWVRTLTAAPRIDIAVFVDPNRAAADALAARYGANAARAATLSEALDRFDLDVAIVLTPPASHAAVCAAALDAGLHVLSEKPLTLTLSDAADLVDRATGRGRVLAVMQNHGRDPAFAAFAGGVRAAALGAPLLVTAETFVPLHDAGFRRGQLLPVTSDLAVHAFDQVRALIPGAPAEVVCVETALPMLAEHCSASAITVTFANGSVLIWRGGFVASPHHRTAATGSWRAEWPGGSATWSAQASASFASGDAEPQSRTGPADSAAGYQVCIAEMVDALHRAPANSPAAATSLGSIALLEAALTSAQTRRPVPVDMRPWTEASVVDATVAESGGTHAR